MRSEHLIINKIDQRKIAIQIAILCQFLPKEIALDAAEYYLTRLICNTPSNNHLIPYPHSRRNGTPSSTRPTLPEGEPFELQEQNDTI